MTVEAASSNYTNVSSPVSNPFDAIPRRPATWIIRQRLGDLLDTASERPLTVLVSPAGSGKTATLAGWSTLRNEHGGGTVRWITGRPDLTAEQLGAALLRAGGPDAPAGADQRPEADPIRAGHAVVRHLEATGDVPDVVVVDDAHLLSRAALDVVHDLLRSAPTAVRLVLSTRHDLPLPLVDLELAGWAHVVRGDQLVFTDAEAVELVAMHGVSDADDQAAVITRSRGWAAALVLGAHALAGAADRAAARATLVGTSQPILDYLLGEVFTTLPARIRHVLLCTGANETVTASQAIVLSGEPDAPALLAELSRAGLLVTVHDSVNRDEPRWTYHPLLRELLRRHVGPGGGERPLYAAAQLRGALHYLAHGEVAEAVEHAVRAGYTPRLVDLLIEHGTTLLAAGHHRLLATALDEIPVLVKESHPALTAVVALQRCAVLDLETATRLAPRIIAAAGDIVDADNAGSTTDGAAVATAAHTVALVTDGAILQTWLARIGWADLDTSLATARHVLGCRSTSDGDATGPDHDHARSGFGPARRWPPALARKTWLMIELAAAEVAAGALDSAAAHLSEAAATARAMGHRALIANAAAHQAVLAALDGAAQTAAELAEQALDAATFIGLPDPPVLARAHLALTWSSLQQLDLPAARLHRDHLAHLDQTGFDPLLEGITRAADAALLVATSEGEAARRHLSSPPAAVGAAQPYVTWLLAVLRGHLAAASGDHAEAARQAATVLPHDWHGAGTVYDGWQRLRAGDDGALAVFDELLDRSRERVSLGSCASAFAARTRILLARGDRGGARGSLRDLLTLIGPQRLFYPILVASDGAPGLLMLLHAETLDPDPHPSAREAYAALVAHLPEPGAPARPETCRPTATPPVAARRQASYTVPDPPIRRQAGDVVLTPREADVLAELALGDSYVDIGRTLYVTENTVKTHVSALYRKLGSTRRAEALRHARSLGLI